MAILVTARGLGESFSARPLFDGVCFQAYATPGPYLWCHPRGAFKTTTHLRAISSQQKAVLEKLESSSCEG